MSQFASIRHRLRQGVAALLTRNGSGAGSLAIELLMPGELALFRRMSAHDQAHSERVAGRLLANGHFDSDLIAAALLHDVAKAGTPQFPGGVRLPDRVLRVLLGRFALGGLRWLASELDRPLCRGLYLAVHHARLGAELAHAAGSSERTCWLIAAHEASVPQDPDLQRLIASDGAAT